MEKKKTLAKPATKKKVSAKKKVVTKISKVAPVVPMVGSKLRKWDTYSLQFLVLLILFAGFSIYAIFSFYLSTNNYISLYSSVTDISSEGQDPQLLEVFKDVKEGDYAWISIRNLRDMGIISGYEDGSYRPSDSINRAEFLHTITKAVEADLTGKLYSKCFTDVKDEWFAPFVCYAKENKWISGYPNGAYHPSQSVVYGEALKIVLMAFKVEIPKVLVAAPMDGVKVTDWFAPYVKAALDNGIIDLGGTFDATRNITRADLADLIYRAMPDKNSSK